MFVPDRTELVLQYWDLDMASETILLVFNKPVDYTSLDATAAYIASDAVAIASTVSIQLSSLSSSAALTPVGSAAGLNGLIMQLAPSDVNSLKRQPVLCASTANCFLRFSSLLVRDPTAHETVVEISENQWEAPFYRYGEIVHQPVTAVDAISCRQLIADQVLTEIYLRRYITCVILLISRAICFSYVLLL